MCLLFSTALLNIFPCRNLCPNGTYSLGAQIKCTLCLPGSKCPSITEGPTICPPGYFSERNAEDCKLCEAGKQCTDPACKINLNSEKVITSPAYVKRVCSEVQKTIIIAVIIIELLYACIFQLLSHVLQGIIPTLAGYNVYLAKGDLDVKKGQPLIAHLKAS